MSWHLWTRNISSKSVHTFLSNLANKQTDRQTDKRTRANAFTSYFVGGNCVTHAQMSNETSKERTHNRLLRELSSEHSRQQQRAHMQPLLQNNITTANIWQCVISLRHFVFLPRLTPSPKFRLTPNISQSGKSFFRLDSSITRSDYSLSDCSVIGWDQTSYRYCSLSNATFSFWIMWRSSSSKSDAVYKMSSKSDYFSLRYGNLTIFKMAAVRHLRIVLPPYKTTHNVCCWPQLPVKFHVNLIHRSEDIAIWIFRIFGLKCPKMGVLGDFGPRKMWYSSSRPQKAHFCVNLRLCPCNVFDVIVSP